jgi:hypothetical protein
MLLAVQAYASVVPIIHCWENDLGSNGGVVLYVGAENDQAAVQEIPSGNHNYMSESHFPPTLFWSGYTGFLRKYSYGNPPAALDWMLNDGTNLYEVQMSTQATMKQCNPTGVVGLSFYYQAAADAFQHLNQVSTASRIEFVLRQEFGFPYEGMGSWTWAATANGFVGTLSLHRPDAGHSQYMLAAQAAGMAGERASNAFTASLNSAVDVTASIIYLAGNSTTTDTIGIVVTPPTPSVAPHPPVALPPNQIPENPVIPFADCWERNGTTVWMYFGVNNTNSAPVHIPGGSNNIIQTLPDYRALPTPETFPVGFSSFAAAVPINLPPNQSPSAQWVLLNHYVNLLGQGSSQECKTQDSSSVWIYFTGTMPVTLDIVTNLETLVAQQVPGAALSQFSIILNTDPTNWHMEITITRGPVSAWRSSAYLYSAFYNFNTFATALETLTSSAPVSLNVHPTAVEVQGSHRASPTSPIHIPTGAPTNPPHKKLNGGAIFGIILAVFAGIALVVGVVWYLRRNPPAPQGGFEKLIQ